MADKIRVKISLTVEVDPEAWTTTYGVEGIANIRKDVKTYVAGSIDSSAAAEECDLAVVS